MSLLCPALSDVARASDYAADERETAHARASLSVHAWHSVLRVSSQHSGIPRDHFIGQRCTIYLAAYAQITLQRKLISINGYMDIECVTRMWLFAEETVSPRVDKRANSAKPGV